MDNSAIQTLEAAAQILMVSVSVNNNLHVSTAMFIYE